MPHTHASVSGSYPTPTVSMGRNATLTRKDTSTIALGHTLYDMAHLAGGKLNPLLCEYLMGFPIGWTDLGD